MTDYAADAATDGGTTVTANFRTGTASSDTVPAGTTLLVQNTGAGAHTLDLAIGYAWRGLTPGDPAAAGKRRFTLAAGAWTLINVPADMGDVNGRVAVTISATAAEVKYFVMAG